MGGAGVHALSAGLDLLYPEVQPGCRGGGQRLVAAGGPVEGPGEVLRGIRGRRAVEGDALTLDGGQRPIRQGSGRTDGRCNVFWTT